MNWPLLLLATLFGLYGLVVLALLAMGRRENARALAGFVPDCAVLFSRLVRDACVPRHRAVLIGALGLYLASPIDLIPDFIPGLGYADDAVILVIALRLAVRGCDGSTIRRYWPGPPGSLRVVLKLAGASNDDS